MRSKRLYLYDLLKKIAFDIDNFDEIIESLNIQSITEDVGAYNQYLRLNYIIADYISRSRLKLESKYQVTLSKVTKDFLSKDANYEVKDLSEFLFNIKEIIRLYPTKIKDSYLIPSFFLKSVIDQYKLCNYKEAIILSEKILFDSNKYYDEVIREIKYWMYLALCRISTKEESASKKFFNEVNSFDDNSKKFLLGFYYRFSRDYPRAENYYQKVLDKSDMAKARREMVIVNPTFPNLANNSCPSGFCLSCF